MPHRTLRHLRRWLMVALYSIALLVAGVLLYRTYTLAQQRPDFLVITAPAPTPLPVPTVPAVPTVVALPTAVPPVVAAAPVSAVAPLPVSGFHPKSGRYVAAWFPPLFAGGARESFEQNKDILDEISPFWYSSDASGRLYGNRDDELVQAAHAANVLVIPSIHNVEDPGAVIGVLSDNYIRARHVQNIVDEVLARNYDGIDIDYEMLPDSLRPSFSAFIIELSTALHAHGKLLTIAVHAKDCDYCALGGFQDWQVIGQYADRVRIMTYDYSWRGSGAGPVAPLYWVESVAEYARSVINPEKIFIGVPFYGYDWPPQGNARALPWGEIEDLISNQGLTINLMQRDQRGRVDESWFRYQSGDGLREVWFMTDNSLEAKLDLVQRLDLAGIAIWRIGYEKPEYWDVIRRTLVQDPVLVQRSISPLLPEH